MLYFLLPAYNEEAGIGTLLDKIRALDRDIPPYQVLVVDDGSTDDTAARVQEKQKQMPVKLIKHNANQGLPASLRDGIAAFLESAAADTDVLVTMDADDTHEPYLVPEMLRSLEFPSSVDLVIASRYQKGGREIGLSFARRLMSRAVNLTLKTLFDIPGVTDYTSGFRAYRAGALRRLARQYGDRLIEATTFSVTAELLLKMRGIGVRVREVPLVLRYDQKKGRSKMKVLRTIFDYCRMILRMTTSVRSRPEPEDTGQV
ncbi:MAG TPA: glycosyltransferase [Firmicutes bacterium]|nr:glycosyltransferase [Bacillota bacterium]